MQPGKRKYYRLSLEASCDIKIIGGDNTQTTSSPFKGILKDISIGGLLLNTNCLSYDQIPIFPQLNVSHAPKPKANTLLLRFALPHEKDPFVVYCEPRWYDDADLGDPYEYQIGGRITRIGKNDLQRLQKYLLTHGNPIELSHYQQEKEKAHVSARIEDQPNIVKPSKFYDAVVPLRYRITSAQTGRQSQFYRTTTRQLSLSGVCIEVETMVVDTIDMVFDDTPIKRNTLELEISIPGQASPVSAVGEVHWAERFPGKDGYLYHVGIQFIKIAPQDLRTIAQFIRGKPESKGPGNHT